MKKDSKGHYTNLASEFYVLAMLNRKQCNAYLTLGRQKSVDIVIVKGRKHITVDVKGTRVGEWLMGNKKPMKKKHHYFALVNYVNKFESPHIPPEVYLIRSIELDKFLTHGGKGYGVYYPRMRDEGKKYLNNWNAFLEI